MIYSSRFKTACYWYQSVSEKRSSEGQIGGAVWQRSVDEKWLDSILQRNRQTSFVSTNGI